MHFSLSIKYAYNHFSASHREIQKQCKLIFTYASTNTSIYLMFKVDMAWLIFVSFETCMSDVYNVSYHIIYFIVNLKVFSIPSLPLSLSPWIHSTPTPCVYTVQKQKHTPTKNKIYNCISKKDRRQKTT